MKRTNRHIIKTRLKLSRYSMEDFWTACPHSAELIKSGTRKAEIRAWRQVGMVWARLCGHSLAESGQMLGGKDHATCVHAEKAVINVLEDSRFGDPQILDAINAIKDHIMMFLPKTPDINVNEAACLVVLDHMVGKKLQNPSE